MASIQIIDTGWYSTERSGTQSTVKANSGSAIDLTTTASVQFRRGFSVESTPLPGTTGRTSAQPIAGENEVLAVSVLLKRDDATHRAILRSLVGQYDSDTNPGIDKTVGVKALYVSSTTDVRKTFLELYGGTATLFHGNEITAGLPAVLGFVQNLNVNDIANTSLISVGFDFQTA
jgi:hypothetical protein